MAIKRGDTLPEPFTDKVVAHAKGEDFDYDRQVHTTTMLERLGSGGDRIGEPLMVKTEGLLV